MYYNNLIIIVLIFLGVVSQTFAGNNFTRLLPRNFSVQVQHPDTKDFSLAVTNSTDKEILFRNCNFDCECLEIISYTKNNEKCGKANIRLAPKDVLNVKFRIDGKFYTKPKSLPVYFYFNNLVPAVQIVKIKADFKSNVIPKPESLACIIPQGLKGKIGSFALKPGNKNIKINSVKLNTDFINSKFNPENNAIDIYIEKPLIVNTDAWLNVSLSGSSQKELKLHIREIKIIPDLYAVPSTMDFGVISEPGEIIGKEVVLKSRTDSPWEIIGSQIKGKNANAVKRKVLPQTNSTINVLWAILDGKVLPGLIDTEIIINTDHPYSKQIIVPVKGQVLSLKKIKNSKKVEK